MTLRNRVKLWVVCAGFLCAGAGFSWADVLASWDVNGVDVADGTGIDEGVSPYRFTSPNLLANVSDAKLSLGSVNPSEASHTYGFMLSSNQSTLADAIGANDYIEISISVASGFQMNFSSFEMNGESTGTGCDDVAFMSLIAGYSSGNELQALTGRQDVTGGLDTDSSGWGAPVDLSGSVYQAVTGTTTFRVYGWNSSGTTGGTRGRNLSGDDFVINGTISPVPEPATFALVGMGGALAFLARRRFLS